MIILLLFKFNYAHELAYNHSASYDLKDLIILGRIIQAEASGESIYGKLYVGSVVINRVNDNEFPNTIENVISEKDQFSGFKSKLYNSEIEYESIAAASYVLQHGTILPKNVLFFHNPKLSRNRWMESAEKLVLYKILENHTYYARRIKT